ncbi:MAG: ATPase [Rhodospirillaceae bacterium]|nr:ATPase [Rhodospirillaceae bacterium]
MNDAAMQGHVIVVGNEKGGSGKSTTAMHLAVGLMRTGRRVAVLDTDIRQGSLRRFLENRSAYARTIKGHVPMPEFFDVAPAGGDGTDTFPAVLAAARAAAEVVIIDTPGSATPLSEAVHSFADTLVTPLNDSFVDLDVLARVEVGNEMTVKGPSQYAEMVWKQKIVRARRDGGKMDWIVLRNRLSPLDSRNRQEMEKALTQLSQRIGFRYLPGFGERVIYRELFLAGLTIMDIKETGDPAAMSMSHLAARQEVRTLISALHLPPLPA